MNLRSILVLPLLLSACSSPDDAGNVVAVATAPVPGASEKAANDGAPAADAGVAPSAAVIAEDVAYGSFEEHNLNGYMALPADAIDVPAVIMIHERWGLNDDVRAAARRLAGEGYAVLAIDLYGGATAESADQAEALMSAATVERDSVLDNIRQAHGYLDEFVLAPSIAALGWGMGGDWSLEAGIDLGDDLDAVIMFYGRLVNDESLLTRLGGQLLGIFAERDQTIPVRDVQRFRGQLRDLHKKAQVVIYPDVNRGFLSPAEAAFDHDSAEEAWRETLTFLDQALR